MAWQFGFPVTAEVYGSGDGVTLGPWAHTVTFFPILPIAGGGTVIIKVAGSTVATDDGNGNLTGANVASGTVNYVTGACTVTFTAGHAPASGSNNITINYNASTINLTPANNDDVMFNLLTLMLYCGWSLCGNSDGTTFNNTGPGATQIIVKRGTGVGAFGNTSAWFRLRRAGGGTQEILVQRGSGAGVTYIGRSNLGFTGTLNGAISATVAPTATDQWGLYGTTSNSHTVTAADFFNSNTATNYHTHIMADSAAPYGVFLVSHLKSPTLNSAVFNAGMIDSLAAGSYNLADLDPYWYFFGSGSTTLATPTTANCNSSLNNIIQNQMPPLAWPVNFGVDVYNGKDNLWPSYYLANSSATTISYKGQSYYFKVDSFTTASRLPGTLLDQSALDDSVVFNALVVPWNLLPIQLT